MSTESRLISHTPHAAGDSRLRAIPFALLCLTLAVGPLIFSKAYGGFLFPKTWFIQWMGLAAFLALLVLKLKEGVRAPRMTIIDGAVGLFAAALAVSLFVSRSIYLSWLQLQMFGAFLAFFWIAANSPKRARRLWLPAAILTPAGAIAAHAVWQYFGGADMLTGRENQVSSLLGNPVYVGGHLVLTLPLAAWIAWRAKFGWGKAAAGTLAALMAVAIVLTGSRGALLGLGAEGAFFAAALLIRSQKTHATGARKAAAILVPAAILAAAVAAFIPVGADQNRKNAVQRLMQTFEEGNTTLLQRKILWGSTALMIRDRPLAGIGLGAYELAYPEYQRRYFEGPERVKHAHVMENLRVTMAHNEYLHFWAECGALGLAALVLLLLAPVAAAMRLLKQKRAASYDPGFGLVCAATLVGAMVHASFNFPFHVSVNGLLIFALLGVLRSEALPGSIAEEKAGAPLLPPLPGPAIYIMGAAAACLALIYGNQAVLALTARIHHARGDALLRGGSAEAAAAAFEEALKMTPQNLAENFFIGKALVEIAQHQLTDAASGNGGDGKSPAELAEAALARFDKAESAYPGDSLDFERGRAFIVLGRLSDAEKEIEKALAISPGTRTYRDQINLIYARLREDKKLLDSATEGAVLRSYSPVDLNSLGLAAVQNGQLDEAVDYFERAIEKQPDFAPAYSNMGVAWAKKKDPAKALESFQKAVELNPRYADAYANLCALRSGMQELEKAKSDCARALEIDPAHADANYRMAILLAAEKRYEEAALRARQAVQSGSGPAADLLKKIEARMKKKSSDDPG